MESVRMDKWLWAARFFKTRALAAQSCEMGRVFSNDHQAKAARDVRVGDRLRVKTEGGLFEVDVAALASMRGSATVAQSLYRETDDSKAARAKAEEERKLLLANDPFPVGRPTKKQRRDIQKARGRVIRFAE